MTDADKYDRSENVSNGHAHTEKIRARKRCQISGETLHPHDPLSVVWVRVRLSPFWSDQHVVDLKFFLEVGDLPA